MESKTREIYVNIYRSQLRDLNVSIMQEEVMMLEKKLTSFRKNFYSQVYIVCDDRELYQAYYPPETDGRSQT